MTAVKRTSSPLRDVLYEFSLAKEVPDAELLDQFVKRFPEFAKPITDYAIEVVVDYLRTKEEAVLETPGVVSPAVSRAMSTYQNALFAKAKKPRTSVTEAVQRSGTANASTLFAALDRQGFQALAVALCVTRVFLMRLRDRQIDPKTMTKGFRSFLAEKLGMPKARVDAHFDEQ